MVLYEHDRNTIILELIKLRSQSELIRSYNILHSKLTDCGLRPKFQMLDNKCPAGLNNYMRRNGVTFQIVPPQLHRNNSAECAIQNFKDHMIAGISS